MLKNSFKKIGAFVCAVAVAAQLVVMPVASAAKLDAQAHINEDIMSMGFEMTADSYDNTTCTATREVSFGSSLDKAKDYVIEYDLVFNTPQAPDSGFGDGGRGRTAFYAMIKAPGVEGGCLHVASATATTVTFSWKWTSTASIAGTLNVGQKYKIKMTVKTNDTVSVEILDESGKVIGSGSSFSMRNAKAASSSLVLFGLNAQTDGSQASVSISDMVSYNPGPDEFDVKLAGQTLTTDGVTVALPSDANYSADVDVVTKIAGVASEDFETTATLKMADGSQLPAELKCDGEKITADIILDGNPEGEAPKEYDTILTVALASDKSIKLELPIKFTKTALKANKLVEVVEPVVTEGDVVLENNAVITDDITLDPGNKRLTVEWESSDEDIISSETGVVLPAPEDTEVTLTATIGSTELETFFKDDLSEEEIAEKEELVANGEAVWGKVVEYTYTVKGVKSIVDAAIADMKFMSKDTKDKEMNFTAAVNEDFIVPETYSADKNVVIEWDTDDTDNVTIKNGTVTLVQKTLDAEDVAISGTVSYVKNGVVLHEEEVEQEFTIDMTQEGTADKYIVRCDAAASKNFADCPDDGDTISSKEDICDGEGLPTEGIFGSDIEWTSSVPKAISNTGKSVKKQSIRKLVTLTATISKGEAEAETFKISDLVVPATSGSSGGSGGGSGSSSNSNTTVSSTGNRASTVVYKGTLAPTTSVQQGDITTATVASFSDLGDAAWAKEAVTFLANKAIINGKTASSFAPNDDITRAEFAKIVVKAFGLEDANATVSNFADVSVSDWYYTAVASAYNKGIIKGYEDGTFGVNDKITRQDMAVIIYRAAQAAGKTIEATKAEVAFADSADIASYATDAVATLQKGGVINGMTATTFAPTATATRAQAAQMIYGLVK